MQKRWITDTLMGVIFLLLLSFPYLPSAWHECLGIAVIFAVAVHLRLNRNWLTSLTRGRWTAERTISSLLNIALFVALAITLVSGIVISQHLFRSVIPMAVRQGLGLHQIHLWMPWILLILIGLHLGMHGSAMWSRLLRALSVNPRGRAYQVVSVILQMLVLFLGAFCFVQDSMTDRLLMRHVFATDALLLSGPLYALTLLLRIGLFAVIGNHLETLLRRRR